MGSTIPSWIIQMDQVGKPPEEHAHAAGWIGPWPGEKPKLHSAQDAKNFLVRLEEGEHRGSLIQATATGYLKYFSEFRPDDYQRLARTLISVITSPKNSASARIRGIRCLLRLLNQATSFLATVDGDVREIGRALQLEKLLGAFLAELEKQDWQAVAQTVLKISQGPISGKPTCNAIRAIDIMVSSIPQALRTFQQLRSRRQMKKPELVDNGKVEDAKREFKQIEAEVLKKVKRD